jgi:hypothetical protein
LDRLWSPNVRAHPDGRTALVQRQSGRGFREIFASVAPVLRNRKRRQSTRNPRYSLSDGCSRFLYRRFPCRLCEAVHIPKSIVQKDRDSPIASACSRRRRAPMSVRSAQRCCRNLAAARHRPRTKQVVPFERRTPAERTRSILARTFLHASTQFAPLPVG